MPAADCSKKRGLQFAFVLRRRSAGAPSPSSAAAHVPGSGMAVVKAKSPKVPSPLPARIPTSYNRPEHAAMPRGEMIRMAYTY